MKPKTRLQVEVWDLHKRLPDPKNHEPFVISNHAAYYTTHYKNLVCLECNHQWKPAQPWQEEVIGVECPSCKKKLHKVHTENGGMAKRIITYSIVHVVERFQVFRYFSCTKTLRKNKLPEYSFKSLFEEWIDYDKNKSVIIGRTQSWSGDGFSWSDYEVRYKSQNSGWRGNPYDGFSSDINCPGAEFLPRFQKYGVNNQSHNCDHRFLLRRIEESKIETLLKANQNELLVHAIHKDGNYNRFWPQIKIVLRNQYKITDAGIWYDYLETLRYFGKDLHSPKYICPKNLKKEHDRWMKKKNEILRLEEIEREKQRVINRQKKLEDAEKNYIERVKKFLKLKFVSGDISIQVLKSINEFKEEAEALKHCVYSNEYYSREKSLILSARVNGVRTETIEVDLKAFKILQSRGLNNDPTPYHNQIVDLVKSNINKIQKLAQQPSKQKTNSKKQAA